MLAKIRSISICWVGNAFSSTQALFHSQITVDFLKVVEHFGSLDLNGEAVNTDGIALDNLFVRS